MLQKSNMKQIKQGVLLVSVNKVILVGRLGAEPESRAFADGGSICNVRLATSESWKDRTTGERKERTEWHQVVFRGKLAEVAQEYLHKGSQAYIEGRIQTRKWQDQSGADRYSTEIVADSMTMLGGNPNNADRPAPAQQTPKAATSKAKATPNADAGAGAVQASDYAGSSDQLDDDIPF